MNFLIRKWWTRRKRMKISHSKADRVNIATIQIVGAILCLLAVLILG